MTSPQYTNKSWYLTQSLVPAFKLELLQNIIPTNAVNSGREA